MGLLDSGDEVRTNRLAALLQNAPAGGGLLSGVLPSVYSYGDSLKRKLAGLLANPLETAALGVTRMGEDQNNLLNAYTDSGMNPLRKASVLLSAEQRQMAQSLVAQNMTDMAQGAMTVWHGSPHKFDKFDASKIGTGEGAQAYGHGGYVAQAPEVAKTYMPESGYLYKVDLPDEHIAKMLDWDKPLSQQAPGVVEAVRKAIRPGYVNGQYVDPFSSGKTGQAMMDELRALADNLPPGLRTPEAALQKAGVPGVRYLDGGSRGAGTGTSNFVVFPGNEGLLKILQRNGQNLP